MQAYAKAEDTKIIAKAAELFMIICFRSIKYSRFIQ